MAQQNNIVVPKFYRPWPHQMDVWKAAMDPSVRYIFLLWARRLGKDTTCIQIADKFAWDNPGTQQAYIGLDNVWINNNIFKKYIDGRTFWQDYPEQYIDPKDTNKEVYFSNNPEGTARARVKFIGFLNDEALIGSSYDRFYISEASLYRMNAFEYVQPIWDNAIRQNREMLVMVNGTPRGVHNNLYKMLCDFTGEKEPEAFPGRHGNVYVDVKTIYDCLVPDRETGELVPLADPRFIQEEQARHMRAYGNLNLWNQENLVQFNEVNAGLVYLGIKQLREEKRYCRFNIDTKYPVYLAMDIASKGAITDATAGIIFQYINNMMFVYDIYEARGKSLVECLAELSQKPYWQHVRFGALPWDSERSASSETPIEEAKKLFPNINWHSLDKERVDRGIQEVRRQLPNMCINSDTCEYLMECFDNYEYKRLEKQDDWAPKPMHSKYSHLMDAVRYGVMALRELDYFGLDAGGNWNFQQGEYSTSRYRADQKYDRFGRELEEPDGYYSYQT